MLWEVERILMECVEKQQQLPKFLLMENVSNIMAPRHMGNFQEWINYLKQIGYHSKIYRLNASKFGIPQIRERVFMLSVYVGNDMTKEMQLEFYFNTHDLEDVNYVESLPLRQINVQDIIKNDYTRDDYRNEAEMSQLHDTPSRHRIIEQNDKILQNGVYVDVLKTITTKQDRNPNSGVIEYNNPCEGKTDWRYLTARECFLAMGFDECDYEILMNNNYDVAKNRKLFSESKLIKMAGNSIVVNVLEAIFMQVIEIMELFDK
jgi:DNA (cytosine-5)-methyltransferase 1